VDSQELPDGAVILRMTKDETVVLFEWLHRIETEDPGLTSLGLIDQSERRVLWDISASLEPVLSEVLLAEWQSIVEAARASLRDGSA
jgi:hypothetical protein